MVFRERGRHVERILPASRLNKIKPQTIPIYYKDMNVLGS